MQWQCDERQWLCIKLKRCARPVWFRIIVWSIYLVPSTIRPSSYESGRNRTSGIQNGRPYSCIRTRTRTRTVTHGTENWIPYDDKGFMHNKFGENARCFSSETYVELNLNNFFVRFCCKYTYTLLFFLCIHISVYILHMRSVKIYTCMCIYVSVNIYIWLVKCALLRL